MIPMKEIDKGRAAVSRIMKVHSLVDRFRGSCPDHTYIHFHNHTPSYDQEVIFCFLKNLIPKE